MFDSKAQMRMEADHCTFIRNGRVSGSLNLVELALITSQETEPARVPDICLAALATFFSPEVEN